MRRLEVKLEKLYKTSEGYAVLGAMVSGIITHAYAMTNTLHNYDNILQQPKGYGAGITSGRWLLSALGDFNAVVFDLNYNLPFVNGFLFVIMIALASAIIVNVLEIRNKKSAVLIGCLMATFPTVCSTMVFRFTVGYYGMAILFSVLAAWIIGKHRYGLLFSALFTAFSLGIYQAYTPITIGLFVAVLMRDSLKEDTELIELIRRGFLYCASLILGVVFYFILLKIFMTIYSADGEVVLDTYQGINNMGKISLSELPGLVKRAWWSAALFSVQDYCGLAPSRPLEVLWTSLIIIILIMSGWIVVKGRRKPLNVVFFCLMGLLFPLAINFQVIMSPQSGIYTIMVYSFVLVACVPLMLLEYFPEADEDRKKRVSRLVSVLLAGIVFYNSYYSNYNYSALYYANRQVENYLSGLITQMRMTDDFTPEKKWIFLGNIQDPLFYNIWNTVPYFGGVAGSDAEGLLNATYSFDFWILSYIGYETPYATQEERAAIMSDVRVRQMPCWPAEGSIQVMEDYLVVKFQDMLS